jgi:hypothetical protein
MITNKSSLENDTKFIQKLLIDLATSHRDFRVHVVNKETHGALVGTNVGLSFLNSYKKLKKRYEYHSEKIEKKYGTMGGLYSMTAPIRETIIKLDC